MRMGSRASYFSLKESELLTITKEGLGGLPEELQSLLNRWSDIAAEGMQAYMAESHCPVKGAREIFRYKGVGYRLYPGFFGIPQEYFEYLMIKNGGMEDELVELGAEEVFCTGMAD